MKFSKLSLYILLPLIVFSVIVLSAFSRTLSSYFLEDDFGEVLYVSQIYAGHWQKIITNFTGNYMEIPTMKVYRPCLLLSLIADYGLWKTDATGYFATNILFLIGSAVMLYLVLLELARFWYRPRAIAFALFSAALFAASPLHCESVSLMVGRVDIICAFFYLLSLWCFLRKGNSHNWLFTTAGVLSFWIALLTKEMAIGLPILLTAICFLFSDNLYKQLKTGGIFATEKYKKTLGQKIGLAFNVTYPLWMSCVFYFIVRFCALGTFVGGYVGSVGESQFSHILEKWRDPDTVGRILVPLSNAVFHEHSIYHTLLFALYFLLLAFVITKLILSGTSRKWLLLLAIWVATVLAPIYQLWGLGANLEGARFLFFLTIPMAILLPLLIFCPQKLKQVSDQPNEKAPSDIDHLEMRVLLPAVIALSLLIILNTRIAAKNNIPWVHAGKQTRALIEQGQNLAKSLGPDKKAILLGIPKEIDGAHVMYNGATFNFIMSPPFSKSYCADRFITFDPTLFGNPALINTARFKKELNRPDLANVFLWHKDTHTFEKLSLPSESYPTDVPAVSIELPVKKNIPFPFTKERGWWQPAPDNLSILHCQSGTGLIASDLKINPFLYDFVEIEASSNPAIDHSRLTVFWPQSNANTTEPSTWDQKAICLPNYSMSAISKIPSDLAEENKKSEPAQAFRTYRIPLSRYWRWFANGTINSLRFEFPATQTINIRSIRLLCDQTLVPKLSVAQIEPDNTGVYQFSKEGTRLEIDASQVKNINNVKLEFSKPNYFFENFDSNSKQAVLSSLNIDNLKCKFLLNPAFFTTPGYYQIRAIGLNSQGQSEGEWSDPVTLRL